MNILIIEADKDLGQGRTSNDRHSVNKQYKPALAPDGL